MRLLTAIPGALAALAVLAALPSPARAEEPEWKTYEEKRGAKFERRAVPGSKYDELRATLEVAHAPATVLEAVWKVISDTSSTKDHKKKVLKSGPDELVVYQQISAPVVSNRDYTVRIWKPAPGPDGTLEVRYALANDQGPGPDKDYVRLEAVHGAWTITPLPSGKTRVTYLAYSEAGGSVPAAFVRGAQRDRLALEFWKALDQLP